MDSKDSTLGISWHDSAWIPNLNPGNIMDYFSERSNPFYDRTCNNEIVKMQRLNADQLNNMTGLEYILLHCQEPILYVVRKQHRHSPTQVTPLADYYIIAGVVYQSPDLGSVLNSRILSAVHHIQTAFDNTHSYSRYHPSKGYWWDFSDMESSDNSKKSKDKTKEEPSSLFQRQRVDILLGELAKKYPPKFPAVHAAVTAPSTVSVANAVTTTQPQTQPETKPNVAQAEDAAKTVEIKKEPNITEKVSDSQTGNGAAAATLATKQTQKQPPGEKRPRL